MSARALRIGVAADNKLLAKLAFQLDPVLGAPTYVMTLDLLGYDSFDVLLGGRREESFTVLKDVVAIANHAPSGEEKPEALFAL
jgi:hypothetical protein